MIYSNVIGFFIIVTTGETLHAHGITQINTAEQAAEALRPLAGPLAFFLFAAGIVGTGLLAVPVLAGSAGYAVAETVGWRGSLEMPARGAPGFYLIVAAATIAGLIVALTLLNPIRMLFWSAVVNGVVAVPLMAGMMLVAGDRKIMSAFCRVTPAHDRRLGGDGADGGGGRGHADCEFCRVGLRVGVPAMSPRSRSRIPKFARVRRHAGAPDRLATASR